MKSQPLDDLEMYELIKAAYPDKFPELDEGDDWDSVQNFAEEIDGWEEVADLLGRVTMLSTPMAGGLSGKAHHVLGQVNLKDGRVQMIAAVKRDVSEDKS